MRDAGKRRSRGDKAKTAPRTDRTVVYDGKQAKPRTSSSSTWRITLRPALFLNALYVLYVCMYKGGGSRTVDCLCFRSGQEPRTGTGVATFVAWMTRIECSLHLSFDRAVTLGNIHALYPYG